MKKFFLLISFVALFGVSESFAQFNVEKSKTANNEDEDIRFRNSFKGMTVKTDYYNEARAKAERKRIRNERNTLNMSFNVQGQMFAYNDAWGGENSTSLLGTFHLTHTFAKNRFRITTQADVRYGYNRARADITVKDENGQDVTERKGIWFKNTDAFWVMTQPSLSINDRWAYSFTGRMDSQLTNSYTSRVKQEDADLKTTFWPLLQCRPLWV